MGVAAHKNKLLDVERKIWRDRLRQVADTLCENANRPLRELPSIEKYASFGWLPQAGG
jgi:hypothetical protein